MEREKSGESIEEAIIVESIAAEYEYLERNLESVGKIGNWIRSPLLKRVTNITIE